MIPQNGMVMVMVHNVIHWIIKMKLYLRCGYLRRTILRPEHGKRQSCLCVFLCFKHTHKKIELTNIAHTQTDTHKTNT
jgi:hypothetical protein